MRPRRVLLLAALLLAIAPVGCSRSPGSSEDGGQLRDAGLAPPGPAEGQQPRAAGPSAPLATETAEARWSGVAATRTRRLGPSPRDYPGPGAVLADPEVQGADLTWAGVDLDVDPAARVRRSPSSGWMGAVGTLSVDEERCPDAAACAAELRRWSDAGASLVLLETDPAWAPDRNLLAGLASAYDGETDPRSPLPRLGIPVDPDDPGLPGRFRAADLVVLGDGGARLADRGQLLAFDTLVRGAGRRALLTHPPPGPEGGTRSTAAVAEHLAAGGALLLPPGARLAEPLTMAARWLRSHPELAWSSAPALLLVVDPGLPSLAPLLGLLERLEARRIPADVMFAAADRLDPGTPEGQRLRAAGFFGFIDPAGLDAALDRLLAPEAVGLSPIDLTPEPQEIARRQAAGRVLVALGARDQELSDAVAGLTIRLDLPPGVKVVRTAAPHRGLVVHHLIDARPAPGRRIVEVPASSLTLPGRSGAPATACEARWHLPLEGLGDDLPCRVGVRGRMEVELPSFRTWAAVAVRPLNPVAAGLFGVEPLTVAPIEARWDGHTVPIRVPFWPPESRVSLSLPEGLRSDDHADLMVGLQHRVERGEDGRTVTLISQNESLRIERHLRTGLDSIDVRLTVTNLGDRLLPGVRALVCLASRGSVLFPESGHDGTWIDSPAGLRTIGSISSDGYDPVFPEYPARGSPLTVLGSTDGHSSLGLGFAQGAIVGGNGGRNGTCVHSRPSFGNIGVGESVSRDGVVYLTRQTPGEVFARWRE